MLLFDAVRLCSIKLLSLSDSGCLFSETPVSLLTRTHLFHAYFGFDANFFVLVIFKYKLNSCQKTHQRKKKNSTRLSIQMAGCETYQHFCLYRGNKHPPTPNLQEFQPFFAGMQQAGVAFKRYHPK
jgi:hypothetical protein